MWHFWDECILPLKQTVSTLGATTNTFGTSSALSWWVPSEKNKQKAKAMQDMSKTDIQPHDHTTETFEQSGQSYTVLAMHAFTNPDPRLQPYDSSQVL
jgi:hypothetical protein